MVPTPLGHLPLAQPLPALVGAAALGLGADPEDGEDLEAGALDPHRPQQREEALLAGVGGRALADLGHRDHRVEAGLRTRLRMPARIRSKVPAPRMGSLLAASQPSSETRKSSE